MKCLRIASPVLLLALVPELAAAVARHASPVVMAPLIFLMLLLLFLTGRQIGAERSLNKPREPVSSERELRS
jgi:hypothetical protein